MSSGKTMPAPMDIRERTTGIPILIRESIAVATGATGGSAGQGPGANKRWKVDAIAVSVNLTTAPAAGDRASGSGQIVRGGTFHAFVGAESDDNFGTGVVTRGVGTELHMDNGDTFRAFAGALGASVGATAVAVLVGTEYEDLE